MKITAGLGSIDEYERFVQAGADEFFCGYVPFSWAERYGTVMPLNRREVLCYNVQLGLERYRMVMLCRKRCGFFRNGPGSRSQIRLPVMKPAISAEKPAADYVPCTG